MKKTKIEHRLENAFNAFFEDENLNENSALTFANETAILREDISVTDKWFLNFKKLFMFFPGILILHLATFGLVYFYNHLGINLWTIFWFVSGFLLTWFGLGEMREKKYLWIPTAVSAVGFLAAFLVKLLPFSYFETSFFVLPLMFIVGILTKNLIDKTKFATEVDND